MMHILERFKPKKTFNMKNISSRIRHKQQARKDMQEGGMCVLNTAQLGRVKKLLSKRPGHKIIKEFKYFTKLDIKCHILA